MVTIIVGIVGFVLSEDDYEFVPNIRYDKRGRAMIDGMRLRPKKRELDVNASSIEIKIGDTVIGHCLDMKLFVDTNAYEKLREEYELMKHR